MTLNLNRESLLQKFSVSTDNIWALDYNWGTSLNEIVLNWIGEDFLIFHTSPYFSKFREQMILIWKAFQEWLFKNNIFFDFLKLETKIINNFCNFLPEINWSKSSIQLLEMVLLEARKYLYENTLMAGTPILGKKLFPLNYVFPISIKDYQIIRTKLIEDSNDFEIIYFDLYTMGLDIPGLRGKNISFSEDRAFINETIPCPILLSENIMKLLRSRNILADEKIFDEFINRSKLERKLMKLCYSNNIPVFTTFSIYGFLKRYLLSEIQNDRKKVKKFSLLFDSGKAKHINLSILKTLDESYRMLVFDLKKVDNFKPFHIEKIFPEKFKRPKKTIRFGYACYWDGKLNNISEQELALKNANCKLIISERISNQYDFRPKLEKLINSLLPGDTLIIYKMYFLSPSLKDMVFKVTTLIQRGIYFESIIDNFKTTDENGELVSKLLVSFIEFERDIIRESTIDGLNSARSMGRKGGKPKGLTKKTMKLAKKAEKLYLSGEELNTIAGSLKISKSLLYKYLRLRKVKLRNRKM